MKLNPKVMVLASLSTIIPVLMYLFDILPYKYLGPACLGVIVLVCIIQWGSNSTPDMALFLDEDKDRELKLLDNNCSLKQELQLAYQTIDNYRSKNNELSDKLYELQHEPLSNVLKRRISPKQHKLCREGRHSPYFDINRGGTYCSQCDKPMPTKPPPPPAPPRTCVGGKHKYDVEGKCRICDQYAPSKGAIYCSKYGHTYKNGRCLTCGCEIGVS